MAISELCIFSAVITSLNTINGFPNELWWWLGTNIYNGPVIAAGEVSSFSPTKNINEPQPNKHTYTLSFSRCENFKDIWAAIHAEPCWIQTRTLLWDHFALHKYTFDSLYYTYYYCYSNNNRNYIQGTLKIFGKFINENITEMQLPMRRRGLAMKIEGQSWNELKYYYYY